MTLFPARRLLVPVDFSPASEAAWRWARALRSPALGSRLEAVHVLESLPPVSPDLPPLAFPPREKAERLAALRRACPGADQTRVESGDPARAIARRGRGVDLIVMGAHGKRGLERALLGSVCEEVMRLSGTPVLAVKSEPSEIRSVLAPVNLKPYSRRGLALAADFAAAHGARLTVFCAPEQPFDVPRARRLLVRLLARLPKAQLVRANPRLLLRSAQALPAILDEARRHDLVVLTAHRKPLLTDLVLGRTVERVLRYARVPVLAAPSR